MEWKYYYYYYYLSTTLARMRIVIRTLISISDGTNTNARHGSSLRFRYMSRPMTVNNNGTIAETMSVEKQ